jgi:hypothetical protein
MRTQKSVSNTFGLVFAAASLACFSFMLLAGCSRSSTPPPGGGSHEITHIMILDRANTTFLKGNNRSTLHIGEQMPLQVQAVWAIPSVTEVTDDVKLTLDNPDCAELDTNAVLTARKPGKLVVEAVLRVAGEAGNHEVLAPTASTPAGIPVIQFRDRIELTITN